MRLGPTLDLYWMIMRQDSSYEKRKREIEAINRAGEALLKARRAARSPMRLLSRRDGTADPSVGSAMSFMSGATKPFVSLMNLYAKSQPIQHLIKGNIDLAHKLGFAKGVSMPHHKVGIPYFPHASGLPYMAGQLVGYAVPGTKAERLGAFVGRGVMKGFPALVKVPKVLRSATKGASVWGPLGGLTATPAEGRKESATWGALGGSIGEPAAVGIGKGLKFLTEKARGIGKWLHTRKSAETKFKSVPHPEAAAKDFIQDQLKNLNEQVNTSAVKYDKAFKSLKDKKMGGLDVIHSINAVEESGLSPAEKIKIFKKFPFLPKGALEGVDPDTAIHSTVKEVAKNIREVAANKMFTSPMKPSEWHQLASDLYTNWGPNGTDYRNISEMMMADLEDTFSTHGDLKLFEEAQEHWKDYVMPIKHSKSLEKALKDKGIFTTSSNTNFPGKPRNYSPKTSIKTDPASGAKRLLDETPYHTLSEKFLPGAKETDTSKYDVVSSMWKGKPEKFIKNHFKNLILSRFKTGRGEVDIEKLLNHVEGLSKAWREKLFTKAELHQLNEANDLWKKDSTSKPARDLLKKIVASTFLGGIQPFFGHLLGWHLPERISEETLAKVGKMTAKGLEKVSTKAKRVPLLSAGASSKLGQAIEKDRNGGSNGTHSK